MKSIKHSINFIFIVSRGRRGITKHLTIICFSFRFSRCFFIEMKYREKDRRGLK